MAAGEAILGGLPLFHVNALIVTGIAPMFAGARVVWPGPAGYRDPALYAQFWKIVQHYQIAAMSAVPTVYCTLTRVPVDTDIARSACPIVGASPLPASVREAFTAHTWPARGPAQRPAGLAQGRHAAAVPGAGRPASVRSM